MTEFCIKYAKKNEARASFIFLEIQRGTFRARSARKFVGQGACNDGVGFDSHIISPAHVPGDR